MQLPVKAVWSKQNFKDSTWYSGISIWNTWFTIYYTWVKRNNCGQSALSRGICRIRTQDPLITGREHKPLHQCSTTPVLPPCELLPLHSAIQLQNMPVLCGKDHPMQRKLTPPLMTAADASLGACDLRMLTVYMSWLVSPHLAFADR